MNQASLEFRHVLFAEKQGSLNERYMHEQLEAAHQQSAFEGVEVRRLFSDADRDLIANAQELEASKRSQAELTASLQEQRSETAALRQSFQVSEQRALHKH